MVANITIQRPWNYGKISDLVSKDTDLDVYKGQPGDFMKQVKSEPVYGPIISRRLGASLGINPIQGGFACIFACSFCQYIRDIEEALKKGDIRFTTPDEIKEGLEKKLPPLLEFLQGSGREGLDRNLSLTICGPTEPTMNPYLNEIIDVVAYAKNKYSKGNEIYTDIFTNAQKLIGINLNRLDNAFIKLDAGNERTFQRVNRPRGGITLDHIISQIKGANVEHKILQSMFLEGNEGNLHPNDFADYIKLLDGIRPSEVQVYTLLYKPRSFEINALDGEKLIEVGNKIKAGLPSAEVKVYIAPVGEGVEWIM